MESTRTATASAEVRGAEGDPDARLAELVMHLAGCPLDAARVALRAAYRRPADAPDDPIELVARALVGIRRTG
ncbi:hypothetical protein BH18ACT4_BH18ACT4_15090 [soil metagenome]